MEPLDARGASCDKTKLGVVEVMLLFPGEGRRVLRQETNSMTFKLHIYEDEHEAGQTSSDQRWELFSNAVECPNAVPIC